MSLFGNPDEVEREEHDYCAICKQFHLRGEDHDCYDVVSQEQTHAD